MNIGRSDSSHIVAFYAVSGCRDLFAPWNNEFGDISYDFPLIWYLLDRISSILL